MTNKTFCDNMIKMPKEGLKNEKYTNTLCNEKRRGANRKIA